MYSDKYGLYWYHEPPESHRDAWGLYPDASMAQLLPTIEEGECPLDNTERFYGLWNFDPAFWPATETDWPIIDVAVPASGREAVQYYDRFNCVEDTKTLDPGETSSRLYELARVQVREDALGVLEAIETAVEFRKGGAPNMLTFQNIGQVDTGTINADPRPCPWPEAFTTGGGGSFTVAVRWHLRLSYVSSQVGPFPRNLFDVAPEVLPPDEVIGPGDWADQRYAYGLPRYGAMQWNLRGPAFLRLFATVTVTNTAGAQNPISYFIVGRIAGYIQKTGARLASVSNSIRRAP